MDGHDPKSPVPTDAEAETALNAYVQRAMNLQAGVIRVEYSAGVATLSGCAGSAARARAIEDLVQSHDGVESVVSRLSAGTVPAESGRAR